MNIQNRRNRSIILAIAALLAAACLVWLGLRSVDRLRTSGEVWVASAGLLPGQTVAATDLRLAQVSREDIQPEFIRSREDIQGRQLTRRKQEGAPFTAGDFAENESREIPPGLADGIPEGRVLMPLRVTPSIFPSAQLRRGDRIDVIGTPRGGDSVILVRDAFLMGQNRRETTTAAAPAATGPFGISLGSAERVREAPLYMYLAVHPEDAMALTRALGAGSTLSLAMHSRADVLAGRVSDLDSRRSQTVELIRGGDREEVLVAY